MTMSSVSGSASNIAITSMNEVPAIGSPPMPTIVELPKPRWASSLPIWYVSVPERDTSGEPEVEAIHRDVAARSRAAALPFLGREPGVENVVGSDDEALDMAWEVVRAVLQGLAMWWYEHQHVPRSQVVAMAMNSLWVGFERVLAGQVWPADRTTD